MNELNERDKSTIKPILKENDKKVDIKKEYYDSGALWWVIPYVNGEKQGVENVYSESGELQRTAEYKNNFVV